jgi:phenylpropionate dioxygenase-like ring-hydroxylating dioxygenase large terminal subunit
MKHSTQVNLIHQIFDAIDRGTPPMAERFTRNDTSAYTAPDRAAREREVLFRHHPIVAGFSSQIPNRGDYLTEDLAPVPILVVRNTSGELRAFANICRHRGAKLADGCGHTAKLF